MAYYIAARVIEPARVETVGHGGVRRAVAVEVVELPLLPRGRDEAAAEAHLGAVLERETGARGVDGDACLA